MKPVNDVDATIGVSSVLTNFPLASVLTHLLAFKVPLGAKLLEVQPQVAIALVV